MLAGQTPTLKFVPQSPGPHPVALLAHGVTASKETLFRIGESLTTAGFICYAVDLPGHGQSSQPFAGGSANRQALDSVAKSVGPMDVFVGHSMGSHAGSLAVRDGTLKPRLFIAVGAFPNLDSSGPPLLLLSGQLDEAIPSALIKTETEAPFKLFRGCDHALEPYDPRLVNAALDAACATVGKTPPPPSTRWLWRLAGVVIGLLGALGLLLLLPKVPPRWCLLRGPIASVIFIAVLIMTTSTWFGATPHLRRAPQLLLLIIFSAVAVAGVGMLRVPRWSFAALAAIGWIGCLTIGAYFPGLIAMLGAIALFAGALLGWIASRRGARIDGDIAMAIFVGYAAGQCLPLIF